MSIEIPLKFKEKVFDELSVHELYKILQLRSEIFVVEQNCVFQDMDNLDQQAIHVMQFDDNDILMAYARIFAAGITYKEASIGRIITRIRGKGYGKDLLNFCIEKTESLFNKAPIRIGAQCYAIPFYEQFGFRSVGKEYDEDGIPHIEMIKH